MNVRSKTFILAAAIIFSLICPSLGLAEPITVTSSEHPQIEFSAHAQGECLVEMGTLPMDTLEVFYLGSGNLNLDGNASARRMFGYSAFNSYVANESVNAEGRVSAEWSKQSIDVELYSNNNTAGYFIADYYWDEELLQDNFFVGTDIEEESVPAQTTALLYNGIYTDVNGTHAVSGKSALYATPEPQVGSEKTALVVMLFNPDNTTLATIIWVPEDTILPFGSEELTLHAATQFQHSVDVYSISPTLKFSAASSGECIVQLYSRLETTNESTREANGTIAFGGIGTVDMYTEYDYSDMAIIYMAEDGIKAQGTLSVNWGNESFSAKIYTTGSGAGGMISEGSMNDIFFIGNALGTPDYNESALVYDATYRNSSGTQSFSGKAEIIVINLEDIGINSTNYIIETLLMRPKDEAPLIAVLWSEGNYTDTYSDDFYFHAATSFSHSVDLCPSACTTLISDDESIVADQTATTGAKVTINGTSVPNGTALNITTVSYGSTQPSDTGNATVNGEVFYDVQVLQTSGNALGSNVKVLVSFTDPSFNSTSTISYWTGSSGCLHLTSISPHLIQCPVLFQRPL